MTFDGIIPGSDVIPFENYYDGADGDEKGSSIQQTADGGYIITGYRYYLNTNKTDVYIVRTASNGDTLWTKGIGGPSDDWGTSIQTTGDGGYVITGITSSYREDNQDMLLIKTDGKGSVITKR